MLLSLGSVIVTSNTLSNYCEKKNVHVNIQAKREYNSICIRKEKKNIKLSKRKDSKFSEAKDIDWMQIYRDEKKINTSTLCKWGGKNQIIVHVPEWTPYKYIWIDSSIFLNAIKQKFSSYPTDTDKLMLAKQTGLSQNQGSRLASAPQPSPFQQKGSNNGSRNSNHGKNVNHSGRLSNNVVDSGRPQKIGRSYSAAIVGAAIVEAEESLAKEAYENKEELKTKLKEVLREKSDAFSSDNPEADKAFLIGITLPLYIVHLVDKPLNIWDSTATAVCLAGVVIAYFADTQLHEFVTRNSELKELGKLTVPTLEKGLWKYSRQPRLFQGLLFSHGI